MIPLQKRAHASANWPRLVRVSPRSSIGSRSGTGSSPTTSWLRLRSTASTRRSEKEETSTAVRVSSSAISSESTGAGGSLLRGSSSLSESGNYLRMEDSDEILRRAELARKELNALLDDRLPAQTKHRITWV